jgi:YHS domain-containing protein
MKPLFLLALGLALHACAYTQTQSVAVYATRAGAIAGYDPVAYFTDGKPVKGQAGITYEWNGAVWHFATAEHRNLFAADPARYAPQYGGWCAYGWSQGYPAEIDPQAWSVVDGKLYLNYNAKVRTTWNQKQAQYIRQANENYGKRQ